MTDLNASTDAGEPRLRAATDLEWPLLLERICVHVTSDLGRARLSALQPETELARARQRMQLTADALARLETGAPIPARHVPEISGILERLQHGGVAGALELRDLVNVLGLSRELRRYAGAAREQHPALAAALNSDPGLDDLLAVLDHAIDGDGRLNDHASPELQRARREADSARQELLRRLNQLMSRYSGVLRDRYYAERDGRYVLPIRADAHFRVEGIVLGSSASGGTLYVEPKEMTLLGNRLRVIEAEVEREELRVLTELSQKAAEYVAALSLALGTCVEADVLNAISRWGAATDSHPIFPDSEPGVDLRAMRHPLLLQGPRDVVANDIELRAGSALIISGPNAGGKTVALKCLGLAVWMAQSGVPLPVRAGSQIGFFSEVLTDIGDDQSLSRSLSTFSGHIRNLSGIIERSTRGTLVLLDEVAAGTDPEEGAALATAVLEELVARGSAVAVTTHYERLKELAPSDARFVNASVGFDLRSMAPTFELHLGVPGPSSALAVAARFGLPEHIVQRAQALLPTHAVAREDVVLRLQAEQRALTEARQLADAEARRQTELRVEIEHERNTLGEREKKRLEQEARELMASVRQARAQLHEAQARLKAHGLPASALRETERLISEAASHVALGSPLTSLRSAAATDGALATPPTESVLTPGTLIELLRLGTTAEVLEPASRGQVRVLVGNMKLLVPLSETRLPSREKQTARSSARRAARRREKVTARTTLSSASPVRTPSNTLDVRGLRVDETLSRIDSFLDRMLGEGEQAGFVLHGHGTGALKSAIREHLSASHYVERAQAAEPDSGGDAFTVFWLA